MTTVKKSLMRNKYSNFLSDADKRAAENKNETTTVSIGVGEDTTTVISPRQQPTSTVIDEECVSYLNE